MRRIVLMSLLISALQIVNAEPMVTNNQTGNVYYFSNSETIEKKQNTSGLKKESYPTWSQILSRRAKNQQPVPAVVDPNVPPVVQYPNQQPVPAVVDPNVPPVVQYPNQQPGSMVPIYY